MTKQQELKERIYKHCPELRTSNTDYHGRKIVSQFPIQLQHLLIAIQISNLRKNGYVEYLIGSDGTIFKQDRIEVCHYNLTKNFDQNITDNPELLDFLLAVIK